MSRRGGQSDKYPQQLIVEQTEPGVDAFGEVEVQLPIPRVGMQVNRPWVFELLRVTCVPNVSLGHGVNNSVQAQISTVELAAIRADTRVLFYNFWGSDLTTTGAAAQDMGVQREYATGDRGILIATDRIWLGFDSNATGLNCHCTWMLQYRVIQVNSLEYVGILQAQQGT